MNLRLLFSNFQIFYSPDDLGGPAPASGSGPKTENHEDVIQFLSEDDDEDKGKDLLDLNKEKPAIKDKEDKTDKTKEKEDDDDDDDTKEKDEEDELAELELELKGPTDEQLELMVPVRRKEILTKYPNLFKDFPYLEKAYYREQQFTELLPTINDARNAVEKAKTLDLFEGEMMRGNTENVLKAVKQESPESFYRIVDEYLPTLAKVDEQAYYHVLGNLTKHTITAMVHEARKTNNEVLQSAAAILNQFVFGSSDFKPPTKLSKENVEPEKVNQPSEREQAFARQQFDGVHEELSTKVNNTLRNTIDANIDPKQSMSDYVRKTASKEALELLENLISRDMRFKTLADKLWENAYKNNFSKESMDRIRSAYLSKARTLLPSVIKKARNEALKGTGHRVKDDTEDPTPNKGPIASGKPRSQQPGGKITEGKDIPKGMSTLDFLNS